jgi:hypothetical protein
LAAETIKIQERIFFEKKILSRALSSKTDPEKDKGSLREGAGAGGD